KLQELQPVRFKSVVGLRWPDKSTVAISESKTDFASAKHPSLVQQIGKSGTWVYGGHSGKDLRQLLTEVMILMGYPKDETASLVRYVAKQNHLLLFIADVESVE